MPNGDIFINQKRNESAFPCSCDAHNCDDNIVWSEAALVISPQSFRAKKLIRDYWNADGWAVVLWLGCGKSLFGPCSFGTTVHCVLDFASTFRIKRNWRDTDESFSEEVVDKHDICWSDGRGENPV